MKALTIIVRIILLAIVGAFPAYVAYVGIQKMNRKAIVPAAPKQDQHWEDIKQTIPEHASDLDTQERIMERRHVAAEAARWQAERETSSK